MKCEAVGLCFWQPNIYTYVGNNPLRYVDPSGLNPIAGAIEGGEVGTAICGPYCGVAGALIGGYGGLVASDYIYNNANDADGQNNSDQESCPSSDPDNWEKIPHSKPTAHRPKNEKEPVFQEDRGGDRSHAGSRWKKWDKRRDFDNGKYRDGTYDENGQRLRD